MTEPNRRSAVALTLKDVARLAGVSTATASMALADSPRVSHSTKASVRRAAEQLNYVPNWLGRGLRGRGLGAIALVIPSRTREIFAHPYFAEIVEGISEVASSLDMTLVLSTPSDADGDSAYLRLLRGRRADGAIVAAASITDRNIDRLVASGYPVVVLGRYPADPSACSVSIDDEGGAAAATKHLLEVHAARRIAHISLDLSGLAGVDRLAGYRTALSDAEIDFDEELIVEGDATQESGFAAAERLRRRGGFDALFVGNDEMAVGAVQALRGAGARVGADIGVIGFDDVRFAAIVDPPLTTVRQPMRESGRIAAKRLVDMIAGRAPDLPQLELPTNLVIRSSCGCDQPPANGWAPMRTTSAASAGG